MLAAYSFLADSCLLRLSVRLFIFTVKCLSCLSVSGTETAADLHFKTTLRISSPGPRGHYGVGHAGADVDVLVVRVVIQCDFYT